MGTRALVMMVLLVCGIISLVGVLTPKAAFSEAADGYGISPPRSAALILPTVYRAKE